MKEDDSILIEDVKVSAYTIPTDEPEADGTLVWDSTTMVLVEISASGKQGIGYIYAHQSAAVVIDEKLKDLVIGQPAFNIPSLHQKLLHSIRNMGTCGIAAMAVSAVDNALWDLKSKLLDLPLCLLLGMAKNEMLIYGSGGFTSYSESKLQEQLGGWASEGIKLVKMKIGMHPYDDVARVQTARKAIGDQVELFVDANGAYTVKQALQKAQQFAELNVTWFEEPVSSDNLQGLHYLQQRCPASINVAAGEYGYNLPYFEQMLRARAIDILQADATRCGGISDFIKVGQMCEAHQIPYSAHCAPALHLHAALSLPSFYIAEYFHDHVRIENMLFDGVQQPINGTIKPDLSRPGLGLEFKHADGKKYKVL